MCKLEALRGLFSQETTDSVLRDLGLVLGAAAVGGQVPAHLRAAVLLKAHRLLLLSFEQVRAEEGGGGGRHCRGGRLPNCLLLPPPACCLLLLAPIRPLLLPAA